MFKDLPEELKRRVQDCLEANDFPAAKAVHDAWMAENYHSSLNYANASV